MPGHWLLKTEPTSYSFQQLEKAGRATWDGVRNNLALLHLRAMKNGDQALIYHSGAEKQVVGVARISSAPYPDPSQDDPRRVVVDLVPLRRLKHSVTLARIRAEPALAAMPLIKFTRLSVMPVTAEQWKRLLAMGE
ncbi:MAG TPA: EVE domain-containing protein [Gemmatimonadales bacterium]|nr:EVE domain-containing protein [Gemmatimonadales bacterium]